MTSETKKQIHQCFVKALQHAKHAVKGTEVLEFFVMNLQDVIHSNQIPTADLKEFSAFMEGIKTSIKKRQNKEQMRKFVVHVITLFQDIQDWLSSEKGIHSNILYLVREKPIESECMKIFNKAQEHKRCLVKDRNSLSLVFIDNNLQLMYLIHNFFIGIITGLDQINREEFMSWLVVNKDVYHSGIILDLLDRQSICLETKGEMHGTKGFSKDVFPWLSVPLKSGSDYIEYFKDYYVEPKTNSYQGLQGVLVWEETNLFLETIFQTATSRDNNNYGHAAHKKHKKAEAEKASVNEEPIFRLKDDELSTLDMDNFRGYDYEKSDRLHLHYEDVYYSSPHCA